MHNDVAIILPTRISSTRLPQKFIAPIGPCTMIEHVINKAKQTKLKNIYVATDSELIVEKIALTGCKYIMTSPSCLTGTDRVFEALSKIDTSEIKYVVNLQADMPFIEPTTIIKLIETLKATNYDIVTPIVKVTKEIADNPNNVKVIIDKNNKALYFSRNLIPSAAKEFLYHVGVYGFKKNILEKFVKLPRSFLEINENNLEQLRALENDINIGVFFVDSIPISVDTPEDLTKAREFFNNSVLQD